MRLEAVEEMVRVIGGDTEREHFVDGVTESLTTESFASRRGRRTRPSSYRASPRDAMLARQIRGLRPSLALLQNPYDLLFREPRSLHLSVRFKGRTPNPRGGKSQRQVTLGVIGAVVAEFFAAKKGLGYLTLSSTQRLSKRLAHS